MNYKYKEVILSVNVHHYLSQFRVTTGSVAFAALSNLPWVGVHVFELNVLQLI